MGSFLDRPRTEKTTEVGTGNGLRSVVSSMQGWRVDMEDAHTVVMSIPDHPDYAWFAVFDGHGGSLISRTAAERLLSKVTATEEWKSAGHGVGADLDTTKLTEAMRRGFLDLDDDLRKLPEVARQEDRSGSTAVAALITPHYVIAANCGDSRIVMVQSTGAIALSEDHKPHLDVEQRRVEAAGGFVRGGRVNGDLAVSRALGDFTYKQMPDMRAEEQQVSAEPDISIHRRQAEDEFLVLACDGIWDVMSTEQMGEFMAEKEVEVGSEDGMKRVAESMLDLCLERNSRDNMSVILVDFKPTTRPAVAPPTAGSGDAPEAAIPEAPVPLLTTPAPFASAAGGASAPATSAPATTSAAMEDVAMAST